MRLFFMMFAGGLLMTGCNQKNDYPVEVTTNFMNSCTAQPGASAAVCGCILEKIQKKWTAKEFAAYEATMVMGAPDPGMTKQMGSFAVTCRQ